MITALFLVWAILQTDTLTPRNRTSVRQFEILTGHPNGWKGRVVDHRIPRCAGGADAVDNYQWMTLAKSYAKDGFERSLCSEMKRQGYTLVKLQKEP